MKIEITRVTSWSDVLNAARFTQRKKSLGKEPSAEFKKSIIRSEHSPLRCLLFNIDIYDIPNYISVHFIRHVHAQPFVSTSRPDIDGNQIPREKQKKTDPVNIKLFLNAQEIIHISRVRICNKTESKTKKVWEKVIEELYKIEPELANACVPNCIYRNGFCPEIKCCGFNKTIKFNEKLNKYANEIQFQ